MRRRNTPTGVGKTRSPSCHWRRMEKHPHGRGEDHPHGRGEDPGFETPPRAWGRRRLLFDSGVNLGNTPTGVGKTADVDDSVGPQGKHPHGRGEDRGADLVGAGQQETPPRAWGRPPLRRIPERLLAKHPHGRGEDYLGRVSDDARLETPPRAWGRLVCQRRQIRRRGNTPTGVGKTAALRRSKASHFETPPRAWGRPSSSTRRRE